MNIFAIIGDKTNFSIFPYILFEDKSHAICVGSLCMDSVFLKKGKRDPVFLLKLSGYVGYVASETRECRITGAD